MSPRCGCYYPQSAQIIQSICIHCPVKMHQSLEIVIVRFSLLYLLSTAFFIFLLYFIFFSRMALMPSGEIFVEICQFLQQSLESLP